MYKHKNLHLVSTDCELENDIDSQIYYYALVSKKRRHKYISNGSKSLIITRQAAIIECQASNFKYSFAYINQSFKIQFVRKNSKRTIFISKTPYCDKDLNNKLEKFLDYHRIPIQKSKITLVPVNNLKNSNNSFNLETAGC